MYVPRMLVYKCIFFLHEITKHVFIMIRYIFIIVTYVLLSVNAKPPRKIVGGQNTNVHEFPFMVSVRVNGKHFCGGSIITSKHILTAAHCVARLNYSDSIILSVTSGTIYLTRGGQYNPVKTYYYHKNYNISDPCSPNDLAIIELKTKMIFNHSQKKIPIASSSLVNGMKVTALGWGYTSANIFYFKNHLQKVSMKAMEPDTCQSYSDTQLWSNQICAIGNIGHATCFGDSGGPVIFNNKLFGIVSYGTPCAVGSPDILTNVYHHRNWIKKILAKSQSYHNDKELITNSLNRT